MVAESNSVSGAGWFEEEHENYGIPFPSLKDRFDRLEESFEIITGLWGYARGQSIRLSR